MLGKYQHLVCLQGGAFTALTLDEKCEIVSAEVEAAEAVIGQVCSNALRWYSIRCLVLLQSLTSAGGLFHSV